MQKYAFTIAKFALTVTTEVCSLKNIPLGPDSSVPLVDCLWQTHHIWPYNSALSLSTLLNTTNQNNIVEKYSEEAEGLSIREEGAILGWD